MFWNSKSSHCDICIENLQTSNLCLPKAAAPFLWQGNLSIYRYILQVARFFGWVFRSTSKKTRTQCNFFQPELAIYHALWERLQINEKNKQKTTLPVCNISHLFFRKGVFLTKNIQCYHSYFVVAHTPSFSTNKTLGDLYIHPGPGSCNFHSPCHWPESPSSGALYCFPPRSRPPPSCGAPRWNPPGPGPTKKTTQQRKKRSLGLQEFFVWVGFAGLWHQIPVSSLKIWSSKWGRTAVICHFFFRSVDGV